MEDQHNNLPERVGRLETSVANLHSELGEVKLSVTAGFRDLHASINSTKETNWPVIFSSIALMGALYAAAIRPLSTDMDRQRRDSETLAKAVMVKDEMLHELRNDLSRLETRVAHGTEQLERIDRLGSLAADKRLTLLEYKLGLLVKP